MRKQFVKTTTHLLETDERVVLLLGDIGVYGFREAFERFPKRVYNLGILEQASVGLAAGLASEGMIPIFHTIAPFMVERAFEQLKVDFGYQGLGGNFVSVGGSYDYPSLGCTHHCPGDVALLQTIPNMQICVPGHPQELDAMLRGLYDNGNPTYYRLSERSNLEYTDSYKNEKFREGSQATVVAIGPMLDKVIAACDGLDVEILYRNLVRPIADISAKKSKIIFVEPYYVGTTMGTAERIAGDVLSIGVPMDFLTGYGTIEEQDRACGLTVEQIREKICAFL